MTAATVHRPAWEDAPPVPHDAQHEMKRLEELLALKLMDTLPEDRFDRITRLTADFFQVPTAYVALIDGNRQWFKSKVGVCETETRRDFSFCQYTIERDEALIIPDTYLDPISKNHPYVTGEPYVRFYAGVPLAGPQGHNVGTFCLADTKPRKFGAAEIASLTAFAALVEREINLGEIIETQNELLRTRQQLVETQNELTKEFADAARYVRMMLPPPFSEEETIDWQFHPSTHLGGDGLGYRRIDDDLLAFYVLDVTGHGLGSALLAVTTLELLRNRNPASNMDFASPVKVIERLNRTFQMKDHAGKFFSAWYGVYSRSARTLSYVNAGHPPPVLLTRENGSFRLTKTQGCAPVLGIMPEIHAPEVTIPFSPTTELYLFTDGLYELTDTEGGHGSYNEFFAYLEEQVEEGKAAWDAIRQWLDRAREKRMMDDDVTLLRFATRP